MKAAITFLCVISVISLFAVMIYAQGYGRGMMGGGYGMGPGMMGGYGEQPSEGLGQGPGAGRTLYMNYCARCHGASGKGDGPFAASMPAAPADFTRPGFWRGQADRKIEETIRNGYRVMPPINLGPEQERAVIDYMSRTFKQKQE